MASPVLPVLPKRSPRPQYQRQQDPRLPSSQPRAVRAPRQAPRPFRHAGLNALCLFGWALIMALVFFSIVRDRAALNGPAQPMAAPLPH